MSAIEDEYYGGDLPKHIAEYGHAADPSPQVRASCAKVKKSFSRKLTKKGKSVTRGEPVCLGRDYGIGMGEIM